MANFIDQFLNFLALPRGNLIYSLVLGVLLFGAFQSSLYASGVTITPTGLRMHRGLLYLLLAQMFLFTMSWLAWIGLIDSHIVLPPIDRAIALFSLVLVFWLWAFPDPAPVVDRLVVGLEAIALLAGMYSIYWWMGQNQNATFNSSVVGAYAYYIGIILALVGVTLLVWKRPKAWEFGLLMFGILLAGYLGQFFIQQSPGDYPWSVRLGEMAAFTLLLALPRRLVPIQSGHEAQGRVNEQPAPTRMDVQLLQSALSILTEKAPQQYYQKITQWSAQYLDAGFCLLVMPPKTGEHLIVPLGYNAVDQRVIDGFTVDGLKMPSVLETIRKGDYLLVDGGNAQSEVRALADELGWGETSNLFAIPFQISRSSEALALVLLSKPSHPMWSEQDGHVLTDLLNIIVSNKLQDNEGNNLQPLQEEAHKYQLAYEQLKMQYDRLSTSAQSSATGTDNTTALLESQRSLQELVKHLDARNRDLENLVSKTRPSIDEVEQLRLELRSALEDLARIPATISKSDQKMLELQLSAMKQLDEMGKTEMVTTITQEFRQPLSSIMGYTDLLLGESVGILGAMQRKFLERVKASTERLGTLMNDLVEVMTLEAGKLDQTLDNVDLETVVDEAVGDIVAQISEKKITMRVDLPEKLPAIRANKDALLQILVNLLQNACLITPGDGEIRLFARVERKENEPDYLLVSVTDQGGGIDKLDVPRIFSRHYKVENPSIKGIGETGVGLSIVKSLVELYRGRIWVDTKEGSGSTFSCIIPLTEGSR